MEDTLKTVYYDPKHPAGFASIQKLAEMQDIAGKNHNYRYILTVIDIFSRYAWSRPLKSKRGEEVAAAFRDSFQEGLILKRVQTDQGREFENRQVCALFHDHNIELFSVKSAFKAALVERFNRTLKHRLWRYFTSENTIQPITKTDDVYLVERIVRRQRRHGERWYLVKWRGYPSSMNSWVCERDLSTVTQRH